MSSLIFLDKNFFNIKDHKGSKILSPSIDGWLLIYYYTDSCKYCQVFTKFFNNMTQPIRGGLKIGICNASNIMSLLKESVNTTTPITAVPYLLLYKDGVPIARYMGRVNIDEMSEFFNKYKSEFEKQTMVNQNTEISAPVISSYNIAGKSCYLTFDDAYKSKNLATGYNPDYSQMNRGQFSAR